MGKSLVIVESPAKAKTINKYLGKDYVVRASVGHIRDLPSRNPKGVKNPVPGVDLEKDFEPHYVVDSGKKKVVAELKKLSKESDMVYLATDLDREGEAIAWHLAEALKLDPEHTRRVVFDEITRSAIQEAFAEPRGLHMERVNAQQARRILDRIVGYMASPFLWRKVATGLSAGRVQSVALRLLVDREVDIRAFRPDERWNIEAFLTPEAGKVGAVGDAWRQLLGTTDERGKGPSKKALAAFLQEHGCFRADLVELKGQKFSIRATADEPRDLQPDVLSAAEAVGLAEVSISETENPDGKGLAGVERALSGQLLDGVTYRVADIERKPSKANPRPPFVTSSLQMAASSALRFPPRRTMRVAQRLYENGLITYMRTDATNLSGESISLVRQWIDGNLGDAYLPEKPRVYGKHNAQAQEAHEAIRPTDVRTKSSDLPKNLGPEDRSLYDLIWKRFVSCQMTPAQWDQTQVRLERSDQDTGAVLRASGRVLVFDGFLRIAGIPKGDNDHLPELAEQQQTHPFDIDCKQVFSSPPSRYSEASLVKKLEEEGIGRPSTYASIIETLRDKEYMESSSGSTLRPTAIGEKVVEKLVEAFPDLMDYSYTRRMEAELDQVASGNLQWRGMLRTFYGPFHKALDHAMENLQHAKAETDPAPYDCPKCGSATEYRFGRGGRFIGCTNWKTKPVPVEVEGRGEGHYVDMVKGKPGLFGPDEKRVAWNKIPKEEKLRLQAIAKEIEPGCDYITGVDSDGKPLVPQVTDVMCPPPPIGDGKPMLLKKGRFGKFLAAQSYPEVQFRLKLDKKGAVVLPKPPAFETDLACKNCGKPQLARFTKRGLWMYCSGFPKCRAKLSLKDMDPKQVEALKKAVEAHEAAHVPPDIHLADGRVLTAEDAHFPSVEDAPELIS